MFVASVLKNLLWTLRYPAFAAEEGSYRVGAIQTRLAGSIACQIHYPAAEGQRKKEFDPYFRSRAVDGLTSYSRTSPGLLDFLNARNHPCLVNADPIPDEKFPIVMFSHGLGGSMEMYTQLCQQIASHGFFVVAMEHEDGSGAYAETKQGEAIPYKRPDDSPYSREKVLNFRRPFLKQRVSETSAVLESILAAPTDKLDVNKEIQKVLSAADTAKGVALVGHSFGGASMIMAAQLYLSTPDSKIQPTSLSVLDPWAFSLEEEVLTRGIDSIPTLSILSQSWLTNPETAKVDAFLQNCLKSTTLYAPNSVHASVADSVSWLPGFILKKLYLRGANEKRHETIHSVAKACVQQIRSGQIHDPGPLQEYKVKTEASKVLSIT
jgi:platelet-activating factor acetylhydrolase